MTDSVRKGRFITLEGGEGAGKSTCMKTAIEVLVEHGLDVVKTREPGGTTLGESLREILLNPQTGAITADAELLMVFAARAQHIGQVISPALDAGRWVISDRFTDASYAYQGAGRGLSDERIGVIEDWTQGALRPDLTLLLDVPADKGLERATAQREADRFEHEQLAFYENVRVAYLARAAAEPDRFVVIDAGQSISQVIHAVRRTLQKFIASVGG